MFVGRAEVEVADAVPLPVFERLAVRYVFDALVDAAVTIVVPFVVIVWFRADAVLLPMVDVVPDMMVNEVDGVSVMVDS